MVQHLQHVAVVADLPLARGVAPVARAPRHLVPHGAKVHVDARVGLDQVRELLEGGDEGLRRVGVDVRDFGAQPGVVDAVVGGEPAAVSGGGGLEEWLGMGGGRGDGPVDAAVLGDVVVVAVLIGHDGGFGAGGLEGGIQGGVEKGMGS